MPAPDTWYVEVPEAGRWADGVSALGYIEPEDEYACAMCQRGPTRWFKYLTIHDTIWYASAGFAGYLCTHCSLGMGRAFQTQTFMRGCRNPLAFPLALLLMTSNAVSMRAGRAPLPPPYPDHEEADAILCGEPLRRHPVFTGLLAFTAAVVLSLAPGLVL